MRRPHVFQRSAPRAGRPAYREPSDHAVTGRLIAAQLGAMIDKADAAGMEALAHCLDLARIEAEKAAGGG